MPAETNKASEYRTVRSSREGERDRELSRIATRQHGVVSLTQLVRLGLSGSGVRSRVLAGKLHRVHRGVYAVGRPGLTAKGRWMAAVLACGDGAVLSHRAAAQLHGLLTRAGGGAIEVTAPHRLRRRRGITPYVTTLRPEDRSVVERIPCTSVARTLLDLAATERSAVLERAVREAEVLRVFDLHAIDAVLAENRGCRGAARLRCVVAGYDSATELTRSELERRFLRLCRAASLPQPRVNAHIELEDGSRLEVDFSWPERRLVVELDGARYHDTASAAWRDRRRDRRLVLAGWIVVRFGWRDVVGDAGEVSATVRRLLVARNALSSAM